VRHAVWFVLLSLCAASVQAAPDCAALKALTLPNTKIDTAAIVPAAGYVPDKPFEFPMEPFPPFKALAAFCRVVGHVQPAADSNIAFELWLPLENWNGKFVAVGNGGYSGQIWYPFMPGPLSKGYAVASTDTGHEGNGFDASFAIGHPEKLIDFAYRAVHELAVTSKALVQAFYARAPTRNYWTGCSSGGRQGLMSAQRYPVDFDGIVAGAPASYMTRLSTKFAVNLLTTHKEGGLVSSEKLGLLHKAVIAACDGTDKVPDGVLENPAACRFDPTTLQCRAGANTTADCLTPAELDSVRTAYAPFEHTGTKTRYPGLAFGSETGWATQLGPMFPKPVPLGLGTFVITFQNPQWDYHTLDLDRDLPKVDATVGMMDAIDPNLAPFFARGGKLLQYHGWSDPGIPGQSSIDYYEAVRAKTGDAKLGDHYRLFMAPGMDHCAGGEGPDRFDTLTAIDAWVEKNAAPDLLIAAKMKDGAVVRTRPLCPYPQLAVYRGTGSTDDAASFTCSNR
jgi:feruloyl esterase